MLREKKLRLELDSQERSILLRSLVDMKNRMMKQGRYTDCVDDVILKVARMTGKRGIR